MTPVGAVVDYVVVMQLDYDSVSGGDILALTVALLLIWVSYYVSSAVLLDLSPKPNVLIASAAIAFNALFWTIMLNVEHGTEDILRFLVPAMFLAASPIVMLALSKWHRSRIAEREIV